MKHTHPKATRMSEISSHNSSVQIFIAFICTSKDNQKLKQMYTIPSNYIYIYIYMEKFDKRCARSVY